MSLLNAHVTRDRALVAVDTETSLGMRANAAAGLTRFQSAKMFPLVHANVLLAGRGENAFLMPVLFKLTTMQTSSFDALAWALEKFLLRQAVDEAHASVRAAGGPEGFDIGTQEVCIFGWSDSLDSMAGKAFFRDANDPAWYPLEVTTGWATPWWDDWGDEPEMPTDEALLEAARRQAGRTWSEAPDVPLGGRLIVADLTRHGMIIRPAGELRRP